MARGFYYGSDARVVAGSARFAAVLVADPEAYGLSAERAAEYAARDALLQAAYRAATTPNTRTPVAVAEKDVLLRDVQRRASALARVLAATPAVSDAQLLALGLLPRPVRAKGRPAPATAPVVGVLSVVGRVLTVRIDARATEGARKPDAAMAAAVYSFVGDAPPDDPRLYHFEGLAPRERYAVRFPDSVPSGATAWVSAAWVSRSGKAGPACPPVQATIQGGPVLAAAA